jgi:F-type H+-transporting ATPase subunit alpha
MPVAEQVAIVKAANDAALDDVSVADCRRFEAEYLAWLRANRAELLQQLTEKQQLDDELAKALEAAAVEFKNNFVSSQEAPGAAGGYAEPGTAAGSPAADGDATDVE